MSPTSTSSSNNCQLAKASLNEIRCGLDCDDGSNKPTSRLQKYRLTEKGSLVLREF